MFNPSSFLHNILLTFRSPERVAAEERKLEKEQRALRRKVVKVELPPKVQQSRGLIYSKKRCGDEAPKERKPKLPREKQKRKRTYRPKQRDPNDAERFLEFTTRIKEQSERVFPNISVPYSQLVAQSRLSHVPAKDRKGMSHTKFMEQDQEMSDKLMRKLERIERFRCGKCLVDVEKVCSF